MWHDQKIKILSPEEGYNKLFLQYKSYHDHLDSFERGSFLQLLPRDLTGMDILDIGAGDGRMYKFFKNKKLNSFVACDIAKSLLNQHPRSSEVKTVVCDLETELPFDQNYFDIVLSFFVLDHIKHMQSLFNEIYKTLKPGGRFVIWHFIQRRAVEFKIDDIKFKVNRYNYRLQELKKLLQNELFEVNLQEVFNKKDLIGWIIIAKKSLRSYI